MVDGLYMTFNQGFSSTREYGERMICPSVSYSFWSNSPTTSLKVGQSLKWDDLLSNAIRQNYDNDLLHLDILQRKVNRLSLSAQETESQLPNLVSTLDSLRNQLSSLHNDASIPNNRITAFTEALSDFSSKLSAFEDKFLQIQTNVNNLKDKIDALMLDQTVGTDDEESSSTVLIITKISITDEVIGERNGYPFRQWQFTIDGYLSKREKIDSHSQEDRAEVIISNYSVNVETLENGDTLFKISVETINYGDAPVIKCSIGDTESSLAAFEEIPGVPASFICTNYSYSDSYNDLNMHVWTVAYEGNAIVHYEGELEDKTDISTSYEINGSTARTVDGDIVALRRSEAPIMKKSITKYSDSADRLTTPGSTYQGGIVISENVIQETIKNNNVVTHTYYKHTIEIEGTDGSSEGEQTAP